MNHTLWTLAVQHPNLNNVTQVFSFDYKSVAPYGSISKSISHYKDSTFEAKDWSFLISIMQMIQECSLERSFTMIFWWKLDLQGMCNQRCCYRKIKRLSLSSKVGLFRGKFTLMAMSVCCLHQMRTLFFQTLHERTWLLSRHCHSRFFFLLCSSQACDLIWSFSKTVFFCWYIECWDKYRKQSFVRERWSEMLVSSRLWFCKKHRLRKNERFIIVKSKERFQWAKISALYYRPNWGPA